MYAKDIMKRNVVFVHPEDKIRDAVKKMVENGISGLPVIDREKRLIGVVTETDILGYGKLFVVPGYLELLETMLYRQTPEAYKEEVKKTFDESVEKVMSQNSITVAPYAPLGEVSSIMSDKDINRVLVVEDGMVRGLISRIDILEKLCDLI